MRLGMQPQVQEPRWRTFSFSWHDDANCESALGTSVPCYQRNDSCNDAFFQHCVISVTYQWVSERLIIVAIAMSQASSKTLAHSSMTGVILPDGVAGTDEAREAKIEETLRRLGVKGAEKTKQAVPPKEEPKNLNEQLSSVFDVRAYPEPVSA